MGGVREDQPGLRAKLEFSYLVILLAELAEHLPNTVDIEIPMPIVMALRGKFGASLRFGKFSETLKRYRRRDRFGFIFDEF